MKAALASHMNIRRLQRAVVSVASPDQFLADRLYGHYRTDFGISKTGALVDGWTRRAGTTPAYAQTLTKRPTVLSSHWAGRDVLSASGAQNLRWASVAAIPRPFAVAYFATGSGSALGEYGDAVVSDKGGWFYGNNAPMLANVGAATSTKSAQYGQPLHPTHPALFVHWYGTTHADHKLFVNGYEWPLVNGGSSGNPSTDSANGRYNLFSRNDGTSQFLTGKLAEQALWINPTTNDIADYLAYAKSFWTGLRPWSVAMFGDSNMAAYLGQASERSLLYSTAENPSDCVCYDYSTPGHAISHQSNLYAGGTATPSIKGWAGVQVILFRIGTNDLAGGATGLTVFNSLQTFISTVDQYNGGAEFIVNAIPPTAGGSVNETERLDFNSRISGLVRSTTGKTVHIVDGYNVHKDLGGLETAGRRLHTDFLQDADLHLKTSGRAIIAAFNRAKIRELGGP